MLRKKDAMVRIKTCITKANLQEIDRIAELTRRSGAVFKYASFAIPKTGMLEEADHCRITAEEFLDIRKRFAKQRAGYRKEKRLFKEKKARQKKGFWERRYLFDCVAGHSSTFIDPYGRMKACLILSKPSYDIRKEGVREGWENIKKFVNNLKAPPDWGCYACEYRDWCYWCPARAHLDTGDIFGCSPYLREIARMKKERQEAWKENSKIEGGR